MPLSCHTVPCSHTMIGIQRRPITTRRGPVRKERTRRLGRPGRPGGPFTTNGEAKVALESGGRRLRGLQFHVSTSTCIMYSYAKAHPCPWIGHPLVPMSPCSTPELRTVRDPDSPALRSGRDELPPADVGQADAGPPAYTRPPGFYNMPRKMAAKSKRWADGRARRQRGHKAEQAIPTARYGCMASRQQWFHGTARLQFNLWLH